MLTLREGIIELYKKVATSIPKDVEEALKAALSKETDPQKKDSLHTLLNIIAVARTSARPVCEDTGFPVFFVKVPKGLSHQHIREVILEATRIATQKIPLRPNAVDSVTGHNSGDNVGEYFPMVYIEEIDGPSLTVELMLRGGKCENLGKTYALPSTLRFGKSAPGDENRLAERDLDGVRNCVLDAVCQSSGKGCPPYSIGVAIGGARDQVALLSRMQLMRKINDTNANGTISQLETALLQDINNLGRDLSEFGAATTALGVKITAAHRHPESYFVDVSFSCWAHRRGKLIW